MTAIQIKHLLAQKLINGDHNWPALTSGHDHETKPATTILTCNFSAKTSSPLKRRRDYNQNCLKPGAVDRKKAHVLKHVMAIVIPTSPFKVKPTSTIFTLCKHPKTSTILPCVNTQTSKSRLERVANRIETSYSVTYMNREIPTTKASQVLGSNSPRIEQDILLGRLHCERARNRAFILSGLNQVFC